MLRFSTDDGRAITALAVVSLSRTLGCRLEPIEWTGHYKEWNGIALAHSDADRFHAEGTNACVVVQLDHQAPWWALADVGINEHPSKPSAEHVRRKALRTPANTPQYDPTTFGEWVIHFRWRYAPSAVARAVTHALARTIAHDYTALRAAGMATTRDRAAVFALTQMAQIEEYAHA